MNNSRGVQRGRRVAVAVVALGGWWGVREIDGMWKGRQQEKVGWWAGGGV